MSRWTDPEYQWNWGCIGALLAAVAFWVLLGVLLWAVFR